MFYALYLYPLLNLQIITFTVILPKNIYLEFKNVNVKKSNKMYCLWFIADLIKALIFFKPQQDESIEGTDLKSSEEIRWETAVNRLASEAVRRLSADNVTVVLIKICSSRHLTSKFESVL